MSDATRATSLLEELESVQKQGGQIRLGVTVGVLLMFGLFSLNTYSKITSFDDEALMIHLQEQAAQTIWPRVSRELDEIAADAVPAISNALVDESENLLPALSAKLALEAATLQTNLNKKIKTSLDGALAAELQTHDAELRAALPALSSDTALYDDLVRRLQTTGQQWAMGELDTTFSEHVQVLQSINDSVDTLQAQVAKEKAAGKRDDATLDDTMSLFIEILNARLNEEG